MPQPSTIAALEQRLERAAANPKGLLIMRPDEAQQMLNEIRHLRDNRAHRIEDYATDITRSWTSYSGKVVLRSRAVVNERPKQVQTEVDEFVWGMQGRGFHEQVMAELRHRLVEKIVEEMDPAVRIERYPMDSYAPPGLRAQAMRQPNPFVTLPAGSGLGQ